MCAPAPKSLARVRRWVRAVAVTMALAAVAPAPAQQPEAEAPFSWIEVASLVTALSAAPAHGLPQISSDALVVANGGSDLQQKLTDALMAYARAQRGGRVDWTAAPREWALRPVSGDLATEFRQARAEGALPIWIAGLAPSHAAYRVLFDEHARYAKIVADGGWMQIPAGDTLREGDVGPRVVALRTRLAAEGYDTAASETFDAALTAQVMAFQRSRRLPEDGIVGSATLAALHAPAEEALAAIEFNMERERWLPRPLPPTRVEVNIAAAELNYYRDGAPVLAMRVIVGAPRHETPMLVAAIEAVTFNPPWVVPASIARDEILPRAAEEPTYLERNGYVLMDGRLVQSPGPHNALGFVKFELPNPFSVYLHDTPERSLFAQERRARSHGCMRAENPRGLAAELLGFAPADIDSAIETGETQTLPLTQPVPIIVVYRSVHAGADGALQFERDVYGWDRMLARLLESDTAARRAASETECAPA